MAKKTTVEVEMEDINLMPIMNLLCLLIPFLLLSAQFIQIGIILVDTPRKSAAKKDQNKDQNKKILGLEVHINQGGYAIKTKERVSSLCGGNTDGKHVCIPVTHVGSEKRYNAKQLQKELYAKVFKPNYKRNNDPDPANRYFADWGKVIIKPESTVRYETVIKTLDATRELPKQASGEIDGVSGTPACVFKKIPGKKGWDLQGNCMFPLVSVGN